MAKATINTDMQLVVPTKLSIGDLLVSKNDDNSVVLITYVSDHCNKEGRGLIVTSDGNVSVVADLWVSLSQPNHPWRVPNTGTSITFTQE